MLWDIWHLFRAFDQLHINHNKLFFIGISMWNVESWRERGKLSAESRLSMEETHDECNFFQEFCVCVHRRDHCHEIHETDEPIHKKNYRKRNIWAPNGGNWKKEKKEKHFVFYTKGELRKERKSREKLT